MKTLNNRDWFWATIFLSVSVIGLSVFFIYPIISSFSISLTDWGLLGDMEFIGFQNYIHAFTDKTAVKVFGNTILFTAVTVPILLAIPLLLAIAMDQKVRGIRFFRAAYFLPTISSMVAMSMVWQWLFNKDFGLINYFLGFVGIDGPNWLSSPHYALWGIIIVSIWRGAGYNMMLFLAGLQNIPGVYYEAAEIDGCSPIKQFFKITIPLLRPTTLFITVISIINSLQVFDQVVVITGGGPARSSSVLVHYIYQCAFKYYQMGYGSALGWLLTIFVFSLTLIQFLFNREDYSIE